MREVEVFIAEMEQALERGDAASLRANVARLEGLITDLPRWAARLNELLARAQHVSSTIRGGGARPEKEGGGVSQQSGPPKTADVAARLPPVAVRFVCVGLLWVFSTAVVGALYQYFAGPVGLRPSRDMPFEVHLVLPVVYLMTGALLWALVFGGCLAGKAVGADSTFSGACSSAFVVGFALAAASAARNWGSPWWAALADGLVAGMGYMGFLAFLWWLSGGVWRWFKQTDEAMLREAHGQGEREANALSATQTD